jgi:hypothetical protein
LKLSDLRASGVSGLSENRKPKVLLYCPTYKVKGNELIKQQTRDAIRSLRFNGDLDVVINAHSWYPPPDYRNVLEHYKHARKLTLDGGFDALLTVEHDIIPPRWGLQRLWDMDVPVAYGVYIFRGSNNVVNVFRMVNSDNPDMSMSLFKGMLQNAVKKGIVETSGTGNGFTLIRRDVLEKLDFRQSDNGSYCPDLPFSTDCLRAGIKQYANFKVLCGHVLDNGTLWVNTEYGIMMNRIQVLQNFVGSDGVKYKAGKTYDMDAGLVDDYSRAGFIQVVGGRNWVVKDKTDKKTIAIRHHQNKARPLADALHKAGYKTVDSPIPADALLIDHDIKEYGHREHVERYSKMDKPVFVYPHGAAPMLCWDGIHEPSDMVNTVFVTSTGHKRVMERYGFPLPIEVIGWYLCDIKPWEPTDGYRILFAPIHPIMGHVFMFPEDLEANRRTYERLLAIDGIDLVVRHIGNLKINGLWDDPKATIYQGKTDNNTDQIEKADLVIGNGTIAYMAIAMGKPTIMMNQLTPAREPDIHTLERLESASVEKYADYMRFPFDVDNSDNLEKIIKDACRREPKGWKKRFMNQQFDPVKFAELIGELIKE